MASVENEGERTNLGTIGFPSVLIALLVLEYVDLEWKPRYVL